ncbi:MAG: polysaccharide biosynthesis/export family protein [Flavobacterium sp.]
MFKKILYTLFTILLLSSCATKRDVLYYQDVVNNSQNAITYAANKIQINDILYIKVDALIAESARPFNMDVSSPMGMNPESMKVQGYLVSQEGTIIFPILGELKVAGKTTTELQNMFVDLLNDGGYIKDAKVNVRVINSKVTILGEVRSPGTYPFLEQNISVNQALGYAGDLTINGVRNNVLLIREDGGTRTYVKLDLTASDWFSSPYYYIKQNDVIVVNPNGAKVMTAGYLGNIGAVLGVLSFTATMFLLLK